MDKFTVRDGPEVKGIVGLALGVSQSDVWCLVIIDDWRRCNRDSRGRVSPHAQRQDDRQQGGLVGPASCGGKGFGRPNPDVDIGGDGAGDERDIFACAQFTQAGAFIVFGGNYLVFFELEKVYLEILRQTKGRN